MGWPSFARARSKEGNKSCCSFLTCKAMSYFLATKRAAIFSRAFRRPPLAAHGQQHSEASGTCPPSQSEGHRWLGGGGWCEGHSWWRIPGRMRSALGCSRRKWRLVQAACPAPLAALGAPRKRALAATLTCTLWRNPRWLKPIAGQLVLGVALIPQRQAAGGAPARLQQWVRLRVAKRGAASPGARKPRWLVAGGGTASPARMPAAAAPTIFSSFATLCYRQRKSSFRRPNSAAAALQQVGGSAS